MEIFEVDSLIVWGAIVGIGLVLAPVVQVVWTMRILIASYIALCLVLLIPDNLLFASYASAVYFGVITLLVVAIAQGRLFSATEWFVGRFSFKVFCLSVLLWLFVVGAVCFVLPLAYIDFFMTKAVYKFFTMHIFYFALAPLAFSILFSKYLR